MIFLFLALLFFILGVVIERFKVYGLISGYNSMTPEQQQKVDTKKLGRLIGYYCYTLASLFILIAFSEWQSFTPGIIIGIALTLVATLIVTIKAPKYDGNLYDKDGKPLSGQKKKAKIPLIISSVVFIGVGIMMYFSLQPTAITISEDTLQIAGMYGDDIPLQHIEAVHVLDTLPPIAARTNGSAIGDHLKGHFKLENGDKVKLFIDKGVPPFIEVRTADETFIFNLQTAADTQQLSTQLQQHTIQ